MSNFEPIETQEQLDKIISERLKREREAVEKKYEGYLSPDDVTERYKGYLSPENEKEKYKGYLSPEDVAKKDEKLKRYETSSVKMRIAHETGIPYELAERLTGSDEKEIRKDAQILLGFMGGVKEPPLRTTEKEGKNNDEAFRTMLNDMKGE